MKRCTYHSKRDLATAHRRYLLAFILCQMTHQTIHYSPVSSISCPPSSSAAIKRIVEALSRLNSLDSGCHRVGSSLTGCKSPRCSGCLLEAGIGSVVQVMASWIWNTIAAMVSHRTYSEGCLLLMLDGGDGFAWGVGRER